MTQAKIKSLLANYEQRLTESQSAIALALTPPTLEQLKRKIEELRSQILTRKLPTI